MLSLKYTVQLMKVLSVPKYLNLTPEMEDRIREVEFMEETSDMTPATLGVIVPALNHGVITIDAVVKFDNSTSIDLDAINCITMNLDQDSVRFFTAARIAQFAMSSIVGIEIEKIAWIYDPGVACEQSNLMPLAARVLEFSMENDDRIITGWKKGNSIATHYEE